MSRYATSRVMWEVTRDRELADRFRTDPAAVLEGRDLDDEERKALAAADIRALFELGVHPFVLYHFALRLAGGVSMAFLQDYVAQLQGLTVGDLET
jgi:Aromatic-ring-opening dioxygenase LigAB, LigA subunit